MVTSFHLWASSTQIHPCTLGFSLVYLQDFFFMQRAILGCCLQVLVTFLDRTSRGHAISGIRGSSPLYCIMSRFFSSFTPGPARPGHWVACPPGHHYRPRLGHWNLQARPRRGRSHRHRATGHCRSRPSLASQVAPLGLTLARPLACPLPFSLPCRPEGHQGGCEWL